MNFAKDIFISYTHIDNQLLAGQDRGWVTRLHETLSVQLEMRLGEKVEIWRDDKLAGNDAFADEIVAQLPQVGLLVSVLSPRYLKSEWCKKEAAEFCRSAAETLGVEVRRKSRIIKVLKLPVESLDGLPDVFRKALGFPFYKSKNEVPIELDPAYGPEMVGDFNVSVAMLAHQLANTLTALRQTEGSAPSAAESRGSVYLAETSWDREPERKQLEIELRGHGYGILPDAPLPSREQECRTEMTKQLASCRLAVHLVGNQPGMIPAGPSRKSLIALQNELAVLQCKSRSFPRVIWVPDGTQSKDPDHQQFIDSLHRTEEAQFGADLITGDLQSLKSATRSALRELERPERATRQDKMQPADESWIYVICDKRDINATVPLRKYLEQRGFETKRPLFEGDAATVRKANESLLNECRAAIVFYGNGDECWLNAIDNEMRRLRSRAPVRIYVAAPASDSKTEMIELDKNTLLDGLFGLPEEALEQFLASLGRKATTGGAA